MISGCRLPKAVRCCSLSIFLIIRSRSVGLMSAIPFDSAVILCRDTIMYAAADEDDDNKLESTADITNRDRSEDAEGIEPREGMGI